MKNMALLFTAIVFMSAFAPHVAHTDEIQDNANAAHAQMPEPETRDGHLYFMGHACTKDCSGHIAGFKWAKKNNIDEEETCGGRSASFIQGCRAYASHIKSHANHAPDPASSE